MKLTAQLFGIGAMISLFLIYQQNDRRKLIAAKLSADAFWVAHYLCLGGIAGLIPNFVGIFRELVFINRRESNWASHRFWPVLFILTNLSLGIYSFSSSFDLLPISASALVTLSLWLKNPRLTKIISIPVSAAFMLYDFHIGSYVGVVNESIAIGSIIISFLKELRSRRKSSEGGKL